MASQFNVGDEVKWKWGKSEAKGKIKKKYTRKISRKLQGSDVTRDASEDDPAFLIEQDDGDNVLKSVSEIKKAG